MIAYIYTVQSSVVCVMSTDLSEIQCMQAGAPFSNGEVVMQVPTAGAAVRQQTPFALTDTPYSQPGTSDVSANTHISDSSWQQRPSIQGMALQVCPVYSTL